tara:strand:+ start:174 stop:1652 length:1479 start_codon:yes stop_codon:yes gene_type:complete
MRVVVVGTGVAGLSLVMQLVDDHEVIMLEANEDIGGTWLPRQCYHNLETHGCRAAFQLPWGDAEERDPLEHVHHTELFQALDRWAAEKSLREKMRFHTRVTGLRTVPGGVEVLAEGQPPLRADVVLYTGTTANPLVPEFKGSFDGLILPAMQVHTQVFERIVEQKLKVLVLGGSKAAQDQVWNFMKAGYADGITWVFRKAYWGTNFNYTRDKYMWGSEVGLQARLRLVLFCVRYYQDTHFIGYESLLTRLCMLVLKWSKYLICPFPDGLKLGHFHGGIFEPGRIEQMRSLRHVQGAEIAQLSGRTATLTTGEVVEADVIICATGAKNQKVPVSGEASFVPHELADDEVYRGLIVPRAPRVVFMNALTLGNILKDARRVGAWLRNCYLPTLASAGEEATRALLEHGLAEQNAEAGAVRSRHFDLWHSFDRPVPWMFHVNRELDSESRSGVLTTAPKNVVPTLDALRAWVYRQFVYPVKAGLYLLFADRSVKAA